MIKHALITLIAGGTFLAADLPNPGPNQCALIGATSARAPATMIDPDPPVESVALVQYCGYEVRGGTVSNPRVHTERETFVLPIDGDIDRQTAELVIEALTELVDGDDDVWLP